MILYGVPFSPFVQRVLLAARIKGHELAVTPPPGGSLSSAAFLALSPMGRIPLLDDDGLLVCESAAIVAHLDEALPGPALLPEDRAARARARQIAQIADGEVAAGLRHFVGTALFGRAPNPPVLAIARDQIGRGLDAIDRLLDRDGPWAAGNAPGAADAALIPFLILGRMIEGRGEPVMAGDRPALAAYTAAILADPLGVRSETEMREGFAAFVARTQQQAAQQQ